MSKPYEATLAGARASVQAGGLEDWVHAFLLSDGNNRAFSEGLRLAPRRYAGPFAVPLAWLTRCCGPEEGMRFRVDAQGFEKRVCALMRAAEAGVDLPPLIVEYTGGGFVLSDGNHRFEAYRRLGTQRVHCIVWMTGEAAHEAFLAEYGPQLTA